MRTWLGASLLFLSFQFVSIDAKEENLEEKPTSTPISHRQSDPSRRRHLSIEDVNSLLVTEAHNINGENRLLKEESSEKFWNAAVDDEWSRARELERSAKDSVGALRRTTVANGTSPYVVCDVEPGKSGERCRSTVEDHFGPNLVVSCGVRVHRAIPDRAPTNFKVTMCITNNIANKQPT